ncbi:P-loop containing nucleoside triphosphate hydrolase [Oopsacas minuta]|uniref:P-loop containing nucleoside triphosphate hydrolase n=1 Tax=Oopsacas minuta TaxID=111878 RepID=A0AAV7JNZ8_9METZ|nr:P-loop containing nucleoside triphosphate hydrolase [Oopsacas minuta]
MKKNLNPKRGKEQEQLLTQSPDSVESPLRVKLTKLGLNTDQVDFMIERGEEFFSEPKVLGLSLKIQIETAIEALEILKSFTQADTGRDRTLTKEEKNRIEKCLKDHPGQFDTAKQIALYCNIKEVHLIGDYLDNKPISKRQESEIDQLFISGFNINYISNNLEISNHKIKSYIEVTYLNFSSEEGIIARKIIEDRIGPIEEKNFRQRVIKRDLKLQDQLCYILPKTNNRDYSKLNQYFNKFSESRDFCNINKELTMLEISKIKESNSNIEQLSTELHRVESLINEYLQDYAPKQVEKDHYVDLQKKQIGQLVAMFGTDMKKFDSYRMIISDSIDGMTKTAQEVGNNPSEVLNKLLPLIFYYLKCSLSFEDITPIIHKASNVTLNTHELFHIIFQTSDPVLRGFCIEHYSFSNPVPLYYPALLSYSSPQDKINFKFCSELWYSMQQFNGIISFGLGRAGWNPIGKSHLLDFIFETDFVKGSERNSPFHPNSIDIQMTKNLFGELDEGEATKWAYIDCHGNSDIRVIQSLCKNLEIALIHISNFDYISDTTQLREEIALFKPYMEHIYVFVRDSDVTNVVTQKLDEKMKYILIPKLTNSELNIKTSLKEIGYEILHLKCKNANLIGIEFMESVMKRLSCPDLKEIQSDKKLINSITNFVKVNTKPNGEIDLSFLKYYPQFVDYMSCYYKESIETRREIICTLEEQREKLSQQLGNAKMGEIVLRFNDILEKSHSGLILWKLSQELSALTNKAIFQKHEIMQTKTTGNCNDRYTLEILWREALLSSKYGEKTKCKEREKYKKRFATNFSNYVENGEAFELIDGDNLRFFNQDINALLSILYKNQFDELSRINEGKTMKMKQAPIVLSIFGPQSSGKSTLLNYCFGCKFLTSAGRCTRGIYGSLCKLTKPFNLTNQFLILDTEGLDAVKKGGLKETSLIHFDRTMVLFCLAVSQVVIINVKGELGDEMQNLLHICAYSLHKLRVSKVSVPKIFFVLNQQAVLDTSKHVESINILLDKLKQESDFMDLEGVKISDLIEVTRKNLFVLPAAFNSIQLNTPSANLFNSELIKLSPTPIFASKCAQLRTAVINELTDMPQGDRAPFETMSDWMEMSGVIWDTIINYQDIVRYSNFDELICNRILTGIIEEVMQKHIYCKKKDFSSALDNLVDKIKNTDLLEDYTTMSTKYIEKFNDVFQTDQEKCLTLFDKECNTEILLRNMTYIYDEMRSNLKRLLYIEKKEYEDRLKFHIKAVLVEIKVSKNMENFQNEINKNLDKYLDFSIEHQKEAFEGLWMQCFQDDGKKDEEKEHIEDFENLYMIFKLASNALENKKNIFDEFEELKFDMNLIIESLRGRIKRGFEYVPDTFAETSDFIFPWRENNVPIKQMTFYKGENHYQYLSKESLFIVDKRADKSGYIEPVKPTISKWIPDHCHPLVKCCSGYFNHADIVWGKKEKRIQIRLLASILKDPCNPEKSTWLKLIENILFEVEKLLEKDPTVSQASVKQIIDYLCSIFKWVNYEIMHIQAKLTNTAERTITTLVFAFVFKCLRETKNKRRLKPSEQTENKKSKMLAYFLQKVENRIMVRGNLNRPKRRENDKKISNQYASDFLEGLKRGIATDKQYLVEKKFRERIKEVSYQNISLIINDLIQQELNKSPGKEVFDKNNIIIQSICNRQDLIKDTFQAQWAEFVEKLYVECVRIMKEEFSVQNEKIQIILSTLQQNLLDTLSMVEKEEIPLPLTNFDSDLLFEVVPNQFMQKLKADNTKHKESLQNATLLYFKMYLDPKVSSNDMKKHFKGTFKVEGIKVKCSKSNLIFEKPTLKLDQYSYKRLLNTKIFNSENIFNIYEYVKEFLSVLKCYEYEITRSEFEETVKHIKDEYETLVINCPSQCPSCGKLCERELHSHNGKCLIKTGHQISSMGGKVWENDKDRTAVLSICDDYIDDTKVKLPGYEMTWGKFKEKTGNEWDWTLPKDKDYEKLLEENRNNMIKIWNKFGRGILDYHASKGTDIAYTPYTSFGEIRHKKVGYDICFVIDGTGSMTTDIDKARVSVGQLISHYEKRGNPARFAIVIYRDHCDAKDIIQVFPNDRNFTKHHHTITDFLNRVKVFGGGDGPEAVLDGLATAINSYTWERKLDVRNIVIHIYDAPPHGGLPNFKMHTSASSKENCCCCNHGTLCKFDWNIDVWDKMHNADIQYYGISTGTTFPEFEETMKGNLGKLCGQFQKVGKEMVNEAIVKIFIDYNI